MSTWAEIANAILNPSPMGFAVGILLLLTVPIFLHLFVFRASGLTTLPSILLLGPSGSGKTTLLTLFERGRNAATHTSQIPLAVECSLPVEISAASSTYRSVNDPSIQAHKKFLLIDTPGHGKLRYRALDNITNPQNLKGIIFLVDAASFSIEKGALRQTAEFLHDTLLLLQKRVTSSKASRALKEVPVLIAANKMDLFTALPAPLIKTTLEVEIGNVRISKSKGLLDSGIGIGDAAETEDKDDWLGEMGSNSFKFSQMKEFDMSVEVAGGTVTGPGGPDVEKWWNWVAERI